MELDWISLDEISSEEDFLEDSEKVPLNIRLHNYMVGYYLK